MNIILRGPIKSNILIKDVNPNHKRGSVLIREITIKTLPNLNFKLFWVRIKNSPKVRRSAGSIPSKKKYFKKIFSRKLYLPTSVPVTTKSAIKKLKLDKITQE